MIDTKALSRVLADIGLADWAGTLAALTEKRLCPEAHGDFSRWQSAVEALPGADGTQRERLLRQLMPWRKGPLDLGGVHIDTEWRSDWKWERLKNAIEPLTDRNILDVGCGNGYFAIKMREAGAESVIGVDPTLLFVMQFLAITRFSKLRKVFVLPARLEELPLPARRFDTTFSMGVLYHQRSPIDHLRALQQTLRPGGQLVLETIFIPGEEGYACTPPDRYARMRNVWMLPTATELLVWLRRSGYREIEIVDQSITGTSEQRSTEWMTFESLADCLDPKDPSLTIEGWPAPRRIAVTAIAP